VKVVKNKVAPPFKQTELDIIYGRGFCRAGELIERAEGTAVTKNGAWYSFGDERLGQGFEAARENLLANPALFEKIAAVLAASGSASAK
jgi:recombination protein RecA